MILKRGHKGQAIKSVQKALTAAGFSVQDDGDFGAKTEAAVRSFQRQQGLQADGRVGPKTLAALGLDEKAKSVAAAGSGQGAGAATPVEEITFTVDEVEVPPVIRAKIRDYSEDVERAHDALIGRMQDALANFETTMVFASSQEAKPDVLGTVLISTLEFGVDELIGSAGSAAPWLKLAKDLLLKSREEIRRAAEAAAGNSVGAWIQAQRTAVGNTRGTFDGTTFQQEIEIQYLEAPDRTVYLDGLEEAVQKFRQPHLPSVQDLQVQLFTRWINANVRGDDAGFIDIKIDAIDGLTLESCVVKTVDEKLDDRIGDALNRLKGTATGFNGPLDLPVRKRVQFYTANLVPGGKSWSAGWLNERNRMLSAPILPDGEEAWAANEWRTLVTSFKRD
jgi:hypothetical protein